MRRTASSEQIWRRSAFANPPASRSCHGAATNHRVAYACAGLVWGTYMAKKSKKPESDLRRARERIYKQLIKRSQQLASTARARQRHTQLIARRANADPGLV